MEKAASAYLLPDKIIIETKNRIGIGMWRTTETLSVLTTNISTTDLGEAILFHLSKSKEEDIELSAVQKKCKTFLKKNGIKSEKEFISNARRVGITIGNDFVLFEPFSSNVSNKIFLRISKHVIKHDGILNSLEIGETVKRCWEKCLIE